MVSIKLWIRKLLFYKNRSVILLLFLILPLVLFCSITLNFLNGYFISFEEYSYMNISPGDITVYAEYDNFQDINDRLKVELNNHPYIGFIVRNSLFLEINISIYNLDHELSLAYINHTMSFNGLNFSQDNLRNLYIDTYISFISGRLPSNANEVLLPIEYQEIYNISTNFLINLKYLNEIEQNVTVVGFYQGNQNTFFSPKNVVLFFINDLNSSPFQKFKAIGGMSRYHIYLDHRQMDIFNLYSFTSELKQIEEKVRLFFLDNIPGSSDVFSSSSAYFSFEFNEYLKSVNYDLISIIIPIILIIIIFVSIPSTYLSNIEKEYWWNKIEVYTSKKNLKAQLFLEIFLNVTIAFLIALPSGIGLFAIINYFSYAGQGNLSLYLPSSFFILTSLFTVFYSLIIYIFLLKAYKNVSSSNTKYLELKPKILFKRKKLIVIFLGLISLLPFIERALYFGSISFYNPVLLSLIYPLNELVTTLSLFYSTIFILIVIFLIPSVIIKFVQYIIKRIPFTKVKTIAFELMPKLFQFKKKSTLILIAIMSLQLGFINFYSFKQINQYSQSELEVYLNYGSDYKIYEPYSNMSLVNLSPYTEYLMYSQINSISGKVNGNLFSDPHVVLISFNATNYISTLTQEVLQKLSPELISNINGLEDNEILVPVYLQFRYSLKIGDYIAFQPENTSNSNYEFIEDYEQSMRIKGFFNFLPGLDQDTNLFPTLYYFQSRMIFIAKPDYNYTSHFGDLPIKRTYMIKDLNNSLNIIKTLVYGNGHLRYVSLNDGLDDLNNSYLAVSNQSSNNIFKIFIFLFIIQILLFLYNFINENSKMWNLFQLFGQKARKIKHFIFKSLVGIIFISFLIGFLGFLTGYLIFLFENLNFTFYYYLYPINFHFDPIGLIFNLLYFFVSVVIIWLISYKVAKFNLVYQDLKKYNPE